MPEKTAPIRVLVHADESCLGNGMEPPNPGGNAALIEAPAGGSVENLPLWQKLVQAAAGHAVEWRWVRGHNDNPKNEYANDLAIRAAERQERSNGLVPSGFDTWLAQRRARGQYADYDPDQELHEPL